MSTETETVTDSSAGPIESPVAGYAPDQDRPIGPYLVLSGTFGAAFTGALIAAKRSGREIDRPGALDILLAGLATQKVSRVLAKDKVTSFIRAPFTRYQEGSGHGELSEEPRGTGLRYAIGELLVCPYCLGQWVAGGVAVGWVLAPRTTRLLTAMWAAEALADGAQIAYSIAEEHS
jgi:hypothetical protein